MNLGDRLVVDKVPEILSKVTGSREISGKLSCYHHHLPISKYCWSLILNARIKNYWILKAEAKEICSLWGGFAFVTVLDFIATYSSLEFWNHLWTTDLCKSVFPFSSQFYNHQGWCFLERVSMWEIIKPFWTLIYWSDEYLQHRFLLALLFWAGLDRSAFPTPVRWPSSEMNFFK